MTYWKCLLCAVCILLPLCFAAGCAAFPKADDPPEPPQETVDTPAEPDIPVVPAPEPEPEPEPSEPIELAMPVYTAEELLQKAHAAGDDPKVIEDHATGITILDYSDIL